MKYQLWTVNGLLTPPGWILSKTDLVTGEYWDFIIWANKRLQPSWRPSDWHKPIHHPSDFIRCVIGEYDTLDEVIEACCTDQDKGATVLKALI